MTIVVGSIAKSMQSPKTLESFERFIGYYCQLYKYKKKKKKKRLKNLNVLLRYNVLIEDNAIISVAQHNQYNNNNINIGISIDRVEDIVNGPQSFALFVPFWQLLRHSQC